MSERRKPLTLSSLSDITSIVDEEAITTDIPPNECSHRNISHHGGGNYSCSDCGSQLDTGQVEQIIWDVWSKGAKDAS